MKNFVVCIPAGARCFTHGRVWRQDSTLAMSVSQEGVVRGTMSPSWQPTKSIHNTGETSTDSDNTQKSKL